VTGQELIGILLAISRAVLAEDIGQF